MSSFYELVLLLSFLKEGYDEVVWLFVNLDLLMRRLSLFDGWKDRDCLVTIVEESYLWKVGSSPCRYPAHQKAPLPGRLEQMHALHK